MKHQVGNEIVRMEKVVKRFGNFTALNEVDVSIGEGRGCGHHWPLRLR